ncbi:MAG: sigma-70 family RNA polymerase sigma factor [Myxococcales bacterium]
MVSDSIVGNGLPVAGPAAAAVAEPVAPPSRDVQSLFATHYAAVWRLLRRFGVPGAQLDDAAQEVFWVAARRFADIEPGREKAFLYGVALRVASNELRRAQANAELTRPLEELALVPRDVAPTPEESLEQRRALLLLDAALGQLPLELRTVLVLFELEGLEVSRIAEIERLPLGTASSRLRRARAEFSAIAKRMRATLTRERGDR